MNNIFQHKWIRRTAISFAVLFFLFISFILFIRSAWGQQRIVDKAVSYLSTTTKTKIDINKLYVTLSGNIFLEGLYIEDRKQDTLLYSKNLEVSIALLPIIRGNAFHLKSLEWEESVIHIKREKHTPNFNYQFLIDAFASTDSLEAKKPEVSKESSMKITLGDFDFKKIRASLDDQYMGMSSSLNLGHLYTRIDDFDIENMYFSISRLDLDQTHISYQQTKTFSETAPDTIATQMPRINIKDVVFSDISLIYKNAPDQQFAQIALTNFELSKLQTNLSTKQITLGKTRLSKVKILYEDSNSTIPKPIDAPTKTQQTAFEWPEWTLSSDTFAIEQSSISYKKGKNTKIINGFDPNNLLIQDLDILIEQLRYQREQFSLELKEFDFRERSGFQLQKFQVDMAISNTQTAIKNMLFSTNNSNITGDTQWNYSSMEQFLQHPEKAVFQLTLPSITIATKDAYFFAPQLQENTYVKALSKNAFNGLVTANGSLADFTVTNSHINWGADTAIKTTATIKNIQQSDALYFDITAIESLTTRQDLALFIPKEQQSTLQLPEQIKLTGSASGSVDTVKFDVALMTSDGSIESKGIFENQQLLAIDCELHINELQLDKILKNEQLGTIALVTKIKGQGTSVNTLNGHLHSDFKKLELNGYDFSALTLEGALKNGNGNIYANYKDENLNLKLDTAIRLDSIAPRFETKLHIIGANLNTLGLTQDVIKTQFDLSAVFEGNTDVFDLKTTLDNGTVVYEEEPFSIHPITVNAKTNATQSSLVLDSGFLKGTLKSNAAIPTITNALQIQLQKHLKQEKTPVKDTLAPPVQLDLQFHFKETPLLSEVFLKGLQSTDTMHITASFDESNNNLIANINTPNIQYNEGQLDSLNFRLRSTRNELDFSLNWKAINYTPLAIKETAITGTLENELLFLNFDSSDKGIPLTRVQSEITMKNDSIYLHINPNTVLLDQKPWAIRPNNQIVLANKYIAFNDFEISKNQQKFGIQSDHKNTNEEHLNFEFENFDLSTITRFLNPEQLLVSGILDGAISIKEPFGTTGLVSDMSIKELAVTEIPLGLLKVNATSTSFNSYDMDASLEGPSVALQLSGNYAARTQKPTIAMKLQLKKIHVPLIEKFASDYISNTKGNLSGEATIKGFIEDPTYSGIFHFNKAQLQVDKLNTQFTLPEEDIRVDNKGVYLDQFTISDQDQNTFILDGVIKTKELTNPSFDLTLNAKNFQVLNANREDNELFYGKVNISSALKITGDMEVPKIRGAIGIDENSDFTLVVPESELAVKEREGVVLFVNKKNPDAILTKTSTATSDIAIAKGFDINTKLSVGKKSLFKIVIDERSGDYIKVRGKGELLFGMEKNGRMSLSGRYEINDGNYKASLYNLVKKEFDIAKGSTITWNGDPLDANLDVKAIYKVGTNAAPLMAIGRSSNTSSSTGTYNRGIDFLVYLNVGGALLEPEIFFAMDMPEAQQGIAGGQVYGRIQQLNNQETELNKQVFSLLVFNRFFPAAGSDGSNGGAASIARDNVNRVLSGQLNNFSDRIIGKTGVALDFQLDSYNTQATTNTDLEINAQKKLLNDKLIVQVGSAVNVEGTSQTTNNNPIIGNVSLEYLLSDSGKYRFKGFRKNEFESVIDGQLIVTGIAFIFNREFNKFKELWTASVKKALAKNKTSKNEEKIVKKNKQTIEKQE